jgi:N-acetylmuramoyl-L-alanine amidase
VGILIVLDPGHGGSDLGAVGVGGLQEKDLNLAQALALKEELERAGARVVLTRDSDRELAGPQGSAEQELGARVKLAEDQGAQLFLSLHHNAKADVAEARRAHGTHIYYYRPHSRPLAQALAEPLAAALGESEYMALWRSFNVTRQTRMPAVLVESNFISNPALEERMRRPDYLLQSARGLRAGIEAFLRAAAGP